MSQVDLAQAKEQFDALAERATHGEVIVLTRDDRPLAQLVPIQRKRTFGSAQGLIELAEDFDAPLDDFKEYM